jgi:hypothetical protein
MKLTPPRTARGTLVSTARRPFDWMNLLSRDP